MAGGAPIGSKNAKKSRLLEQAFIRDIKQRDLVSGDGETMRRIAEVYIDQALAGELQSAIFVRDTVDGKPSQAVQLTGDEDNPVAITEIKLTII